MTALAWIRQVSEAEAEGKLGKVYVALERARGKVSNIMKVQSLDPDAMEAHLRLYSRLMFTESGVSRDEAEMIAIAVSQTNRCEYCVKHHAEALAALWNDKEKIARFLDDPDDADISTKQRAVLEYARKLTATPHEVSKKDVESLRDESISDAEILRINMIVSYFNFVNRIAVGLGVDFSEDEMTGYKYDSARKLGGE